MATIILSVVIALLVFAGMAVGLMFGRQPIKGSCGGMSAMAGGGSCSVCGDDPAKCPDQGAASGARDAGGVRGAQMFDPNNRDSNKPN